MKARTLVAALAVLVALAASGRGDDAPSAEGVALHLLALDVKGAEEMLGKLRSEAKTSEAKESVKQLEKELAIAKKLAPVAKTMEKLYAEKKLRECYAAFVAAADAYPRALALEGLRDNAREARRQAFFVIEDFDGDAAAEKKPADALKPDEPKPDASPPDAGGDKPSAPKPEGDKRPKKPTLQWTAHGCGGELVPDPMRGWALRWTVDAGKKKGYWDRTFKEPIDVTAHEYLSIRVRGTTVPKKGGLSLGFGDGASNFLDAVLVVEPDGKWHELKFPVADLKRNGAPDPSSLAHVTLYYKGLEAVDIEVDDLLLAKSKKP